MLLFSDVSRPFANRFHAERCEMPASVRKVDVTKSCQEIQNFLDHCSLQTQKMRKLLDSMKLSLVNAAFNIFFHQFIRSSLLLNGCRFYLPEREEDSKEANRRSEE